MGVHCFWPRLHPNPLPCPVLEGANLAPVGCGLPHLKLSQGRISAAFGFLVDAFPSLSLVCFILCWDDWTHLGDLTHLKIPARYLHRGFFGCSFFCYIGQNFYISIWGVNYFSLWPADVPVTWSGAKGWGWAQAQLSGDSSVLSSASHLVFPLVCLQDDVEKAASSWRVLWKLSASVANLQMNCNNGILRSAQVTVFGIFWWKECEREAIPELPGEICCVKFSRNPLFWRCPMDKWCQIPFYLFLDTRQLYLHYRRCLNVSLKQIGCTLKRWKKSLLKWEKNFRPFSSAPSHHVQD